MTGHPPTAEEVAAVEPVIRRVVRSRVPASEVDDLVQQTLAALVARRQEIEAQSLEAYAARAAANAVASFHRTSAMRRRVEPRLYERRSPEQPDDVVLQREQETAVSAVLDGLDPGDRAVLEAHHVDGADLGSLARAEGRSELALRLRLARIRAKLRVDYTLAFGKVTLPSEDCWPVLVALSSGDRRAQGRLGASDHLGGCVVCSSLVASPAGLSRPAVGLVALLTWRWKELSSPARFGTSIGGVVAASAVAAVVVSSLIGGGSDGEVADRPQPAAVTTTIAATPTPQPPGHLLGDSGPLGSSKDALRAAADSPVTGRAVRVLAVPADEGFWVEADDGGKIWVQLVAIQGESAVSIEPETQIDFIGRLVANDPQFIARIGLPSGRDADELMRQGHHIEVDSDEVRPS